MDNNKSIEGYVEEHYPYLSEHNKREQVRHQKKLQLKLAQADKFIEELLAGIDDDLPRKVNPIALQEDGEAARTDDSIGITAPPGKYNFPIPGPSLYGEWASEDIINNLRSITEMAKGVDDYLFARELYSALSIELNHRGLIAPAYRPIPIIPKSVKKYSEAHLAIQRDRLVIDCHWLHARKEWVSISENKWRGLLDLKKEFQYEKVSEFASASIKNEYRADAILRLTLRQQCQLAALRGNQTRKQFDALVKSIREDGMRTPPKLELIERAINHWCEMDCRLEKYRSQYFAIAKSIELLGESATAKQVAELTGFMLGEKPLSESAIRSKQKKLEKLSLP